MSNRKGLVGATVGSQPFSNSALTLNGGDREMGSSFYFFRLSNFLPSATQPSMLIDTVLVTAMPGGGFNILKP